MRIKRGLIYLVLFLMILPFVNPARISSESGRFPSSPYRGSGSSEITCSDGTFLGYCNEQGSFCGSTINLIGNNNAVDLEPRVTYIFTGILERACVGDVYKLFLANREIRLTPTTRNGKTRVTAEFASQSSFAGNIQLKCLDNSDIAFAKSVSGYDIKYLGEKLQVPISNQDCNLCLCNEDELELMEECISQCDFSLCQQLPDSVLKQSIIDQYAVSCNNIERCSDSICAQKTVAFNCQSNDCNAFSNFEINPDFANGRKIFARDNANYEFKRFRLESGDINSNKCDIDVKEYYMGSGLPFWGLDMDDRDLRVTVSYGAIIPSNDGSKISDYIQEKVKFRESVLEGEKECFTDFCNDVLNVPFGNVIQNKKDCSSINCQILKRDSSGNDQPNGRNPIFGLKADLLCGYDDYWYLCDRDGIKTFNNGKQYLCDENSGTWIEIN